MRRGAVLGGAAGAGGDDRAVPFPEAAAVTTPATLDPPAGGALPFTATGTVCGGATVLDDVPPLPGGARVRIAPVAAPPDDEGAACGERSTPRPGESEEDAAWWGATVAETYRLRHPPRDAPGGRD